MGRQPRKAVGTVWIPLIRLWIRLPREPCLLANPNYTNYKYIIIQVEKHTIIVEWCDLSHTQSPNSMKNHKIHPRSLQSNLARHAEGGGSLSSPDFNQCVAGRIRILRHQFEACSQQLSWLLLSEWMMFWTLESCVLIERSSGSSTSNIIYSTWMYLGFGCLCHQHALWWLFLFPNHVPVTATGRSWPP